MGKSAYSPRFDRAMQFTMEAFRHKFRKATPVPYMTHLLAVTALVGEHGGDEDMLIAALLHDYLEDIPGGSEDQLRAEFGDRVTDMVLALSDTVVQPKPPWKDRKERYLRALANKSPEIKLISAADKLHNATTIVRDHATLGDAIFERFKPSKEQTCWYYRSCHAQLSVGWDHVILGELEVRVRGLHRVAGVRWA